MPQNIRTDTPDLAFVNALCAGNADEIQQDYDEILIERNRNGGYWLHFAVRPKENRRKTMFIQK